MAAWDRTESALASNERATDAMVVRAIWYSFAFTAPLLAAVYFLVVKSDKTTPFLTWFGTTAAVLLVPTLFQWRRWLPGSVKFLAPLSAVGALLSLAFTIHMAQSAWAIWLLPSLVAALYFQPRVVWIINVICWVAIDISAHAFPEAFPELTVGSVGYFVVTVLPLQILIASLAKKAARLLGRVEEESAARARAYGNLQAAVGEIRHAAGRLVSASSDLAANTEAAGAFIDGDFDDTVSSVVRASRAQQERVQEASAVMQELNRSISHIASGAQQDAEAVARGTAHVDGMAAAINNVSQRAGVVLDESTRAAEVAAQGTEAVAEMVRGIGRIQASAELAAGAMRGLRVHSAKIGGIADTIGEIAQQTNMLALNAAIEAARVGEHGKGFAVVAQEVRSLAERSATQARSIAALLQEIQAGVDQAANAVETTTREVQAGTELASTAQGALTVVANTTQDTAAQVGEIARETSRQSAASQELVASFRQIEQVVQDTSAASEEMAAASNEVLMGVTAIGETSGSNLAAVERLERGAKKLRAAVSSISDVSRELGAVVGRLEDATRQIS